MGTALAQTYAATTYSANGLPVTLTDAKGSAAARGLCLPAKPEPGEGRTCPATLELRFD